MSQPEVARRVPCVRTYITKYENGLVVPGLTRLSRLAPALGVGLGELLDESMAVEQLAVDWGDEMLGYVGRLDSTSRYVITQTAKALMRGQRLR
jgi:transcriptional regulator with XRE-family HTH domain